jgi:hypothetical protein
MSTNEDSYGSYSIDWQTATTYTYNIVTEKNTAYTTNTGETITFLNRDEKSWWLTKKDKEKKLKPMQLTDEQVKELETQSFANNERLFAFQLNLITLLKSEFKRMHSDDNVNRNFRTVRCVCGNNYFSNLAWLNYKVGALLAAGNKCGIVFSDSHFFIDCKRKTTALVELDDAYRNDKLFIFYRDQFSERILKNSKSSVDDISLMKYVFIFSDRMVSDYEDVINYVNSYFTGDLIVHC